MRVKLIGGALIFAAFLLGALVCLRLRRQRTDTLNQLCTALDRAEGELSLRGLPLPRLFELLSKCSTGAAGFFFSELSQSMDRLGEEDFHTLWLRAAEKCLAALRQPEREEIDRLGGVLGRYGLTEQLSAIRACSAELRRALDCARQDYPRSRRLLLGMASAAGAMLIILLI